MRSETTTHWPPSASIGLWFYLERKNRLFEQWKSLASEAKPPLPLPRSPQLRTSPLCSETASPSPRLGFQRAFDEFCDHWRLLGLFSWEFPNVDGPKWTNHYPGRPETREGMTCYDTPFHIPLLSQDGLGELAEQEHNRLAGDHGFVDQSKWQTYAQLFRLSFWESMIDQRYFDKQEANAFVSNKIEVLAEILDLNPDRVKKLRTCLKQLRNGTRADLEDWR